MEILLATACGIVGGIGNLLLMGESMVMPRRIKDPDGNTHFVFGFLKQLVLGAIAGPVSILNLVGDLPLYNIAYLSIVSGIGSSAILTSAVQRAVKQSKTEVQQELAKFDFKQKTN